MDREPASIEYHIQNSEHKIRNKIEATKLLKENTKFENSNPNSKWQFEITNKKSGIYGNKSIIQYET
jgi:hypothetical protein